MIHHAMIKVTCDRSNRCDEFIEVEMYQNPQGRYDRTDTSIINSITGDGWIISEDKQYCSEDCAQAG